MSKKTAVQVRYSGAAGGGSPAITLPESIAKKLEIPLHSLVVFQFGSFRTHIAVKSDKNATGMQMSETIARSAGIPNGCKLTIDYKPEWRTLKAGPLLGVLMSRVSRTRPELPFGDNEKFCRELYETCHAEGGLVFFFTPGDISPKKGKLTGRIPIGPWQKRIFPIPDVIYNRLTTRKLENKPSVRQFMRRAKAKYHTLIFNEKFLDKTDVFQALSQVPSLQRYLPESHTLKSGKTLTSMVNKYPIVFLKPTRGSLGTGIIRLTRLSSGSIRYEKLGANSITRQAFRSSAALAKSMAKKVRSRRYQIQQGVDLIRIRNRPVDFRALVQKNGEGEWELTSIVARIAGNRNFVSNLARGGTLRPVQSALRSSGITSAATVHTRLKTAAVQLAKGLEQQIALHFGELGIDLAVDRKGNVWLLEINSKPSKNDDTPLNTKKARPSVRKLMQYVRHLTGM